MSADNLEKRVLAIETELAELKAKLTTVDGDDIPSRLNRLEPGSWATTIVTYEEQTRGWLAYMARTRTVAQENHAYARLKMHIESFRHVEILDFDEVAAERYRELSRSRLRIGTMDLKIAAIVFAHDAVLLSRNVSDFGKIRGLKVEDWTLPGEN